MLRRLRSNIFQRCLRVDSFSSSSANLALEINGKIENFDFSAIWLRFNCHCPDCKQEGSGQKTISPSDWPEEIKLEYAAFEGDFFKFRIEGEDHEGMIPGEMLRKYLRDENLRLNGSTNMTYHRFPNDWVPEIDFSKTLHEAGQYELTTKIATHGYCIVKNCSTMKNGVLEVARKISEPIPSVYGLTFDVVSLPNPNNIAYSSAGLDPHMDLVYFESPPGLQYLLCRRNDHVVKGGESTLIDAFEVAEHVKRAYPDDFEILSTVPVRFQKIHWERENPVYLEWEQPHIVLDSSGDISRVNWAPSFEGVSDSNSMTDQYLKAYRRFLKEIEGSKTSMVRRLEPGECLVFNNRRMLHGRKEFQLNGGVRHLEGTYTNICEFRSRAQVLECLQGCGKLIQKVGNSNAI
ncbi:Oidioi.mRNA.OKI2018_I69.chr2.g4171.t1.cds [Oikopleura dioica]|uniref:Oidioi.mRNA.OKI2018_I69.chr2.g4171.t1.cds n=1 Tax=Oikopleura dioica TaxID=34765 RepID=A0ABN7SY34_OIKDI|nr:Oidioi.mRNA.OKI2018_I69.chr2.g4171.t1.cds [Oikopleura dioica]